MKKWSKLISLESTERLETEYSIPPETITSLDVKKSRQKGKSFTKYFSPHINPDDDFKLSLAINKVGEEVRGKLNGSYDGSDVMLCSPLSVKLWSERDKGETRTRSGATTLKIANK